MLPRRRHKAWATATVHVVCFLWCGRCLRQLHRAVFHVANTYDAVDDRGAACVFPHRGPGAKGGPTVRSVDASLLSWSLSLARRVIAGPGRPAFAAFRRTSPLPQLLCRGVLCCSHNQQRIAVGSGAVGLCRLSPALSDRVLEAQLAALSRGDVFQAADNSAAFFKLMRLLVTRVVDIATANEGGGAVAVAAAAAAAADAQEAKAADDAAETTSLQPQQLCEVFMDCLIRHPVLELTSADRDLVLRGLLQVTASILTAMSQSVSRWGAIVRPVDDLA